MSQSIRVLADYNCYPLWLLDQSKYQNIPPSQLGLSGGLSRELDEWSDEYDQTFNDADPASSGFLTDEAERRHSARGRELAIRVKEELGERYTVFYFDQLTMANETVNPDPLG